MRLPFKLLISLLAGVIFPLACAPLSIWPLAYVSIIFLLYAIENIDGNMAFVYGFAYGIGLLGYGASWGGGVHEFSKMSIVQVIVWIGIFVTYFALFYGFWIYIYKKLFCHKKNTDYLLAFPIIGVLCEWLRTLVFPWFNYGYSQIDGPTHSFAPIIGVYGLSWITLTISVAIYLYFKKRFLANSIVLGIIIILTFISTQLSFIKEGTKKYSITACQTNIDPADKIKLDTAPYLLDTYKKLFNQSLPTDLILLPEYSILSQTNLIREFQNFAQKHNLAVVFGIPDEVLSHGNKYSPKDNFNSLMVVGTGNGTYYKKRPIPFAEYMPLPESLASILQKLGTPIYRTKAGLTKQLVYVKDLKLIPAICYEISFAQMIRNGLKRYNSYVVVNISEDHWLKTSWGASQQFEIARMRALENGVYVVRSSNAGLGGIIDYHGKVMATAPSGMMQPIKAEISELIGRTPWTKMGQWPLLILMLSILLFLLIYQKFKEEVCAPVSL